MMTSTPVTQQQQTDGRTVREVVEFNQELVNEVWCRRIFRQILQSLELQYAMQMPHRPISPDTILILDSGDPMLLPTQDVSAAWSEAGDLHDLAAVVHYAITREFPPAAPLAGRSLGLPGDYSDSFMQAVDRCLATDPQQRPHTIEQLRNLLGIVPLGPAIPAPAQAPASTVPPEPAVSFLKDPAPLAEPGGLRRWLLLIAAATVLLGALGALFALLHQADSRDTVTLALPGDTPAVTETPAAVPEAATVATPAPAEAAAAAALPPGLPADMVPAPTAAAPAAPAQAPVQAVPVKPAAAAAGATYKLVIKPWAMVQVDGVDHGASPPLKRLTLTPGQHTIRIVNPNFPEHTVSLNAVKGATAVIEMDFTEEETP
ncbi:hypothetical protein LK542_21830 [Massilia sp. IC2-477]|uniref:hypothetical protein n=1 Tax=Massilia sp. IC2-477 TaxID=2887198 RepID=UPI001D104D17|nr:hypothetical protein [Massilia sp. IC2-477]MCC2958264.1 hypothetical protein [Massilia sp. IC2-477]